MKKLLVFTLSAIMAFTMTTPVFALEDIGEAPVDDKVVTEQAESQTEDEVTSEEEAAPVEEPAEEAASEGTMKPLDTGGEEGDDENQLIRYGSQAPSSFSALVGSTVEIGVDTLVSGVELRWYEAEENDEGRLEPKAELTNCAGADVIELNTNGDPGTYSNYLCQATKGDINESLGFQIYNAAVLADDDCDNFINAEYGEEYTLKVDVADGYTLRWLRCDSSDVGDDYEEVAGDVGEITVTCDKYGETKYKAEALDSNGEKVDEELFWLTCTKELISATSETLFYGCQVDDSYELSVEATEDVVSLEWREGFGNPDSEDYHTTLIEGSEMATEIEYTITELPCEVVAVANDGQGHGQEISFTFTEEEDPDDPDDDDIELIEYCSYDDPGAYLLKGETGELKIRKLIEAANIEWYTAEYDDEEGIYTAVSKIEGSDGQTSITVNCPETFEQDEYYMACATYTTEEGKQVETNLGFDVSRVLHRYVTDSNITVRPGEDYTFEIELDPDYTAKWYKIDEAGEVEAGEGTKLTVNDVHGTNEYLMRIFDENGSSVYEDNCLVSASAIDDYYVQDANVLEGEDATLELKIVAEDEVEIKSCQWFIGSEDDEYDEDIDGEREIIGEGASLTINNVTEEEIGQYNCKAVVECAGETEVLKSNGNLGIIASRTEIQEGQKQSIEVPFDGNAGLAFTPEKTGVYSIATEGAGPDDCPYIHVMLNGTVVESQQIKDSNDVELKAILKEGQTYTFIVASDIAEDVTFDVVTKYLPDENCPHQDTYSKRIAPTCTSVGYADASVCRHCGEILEKDGEIPMKAHTEGEHVVKAAGNLVNGTDYYVCSVCGNKYDVVNTPGWSTSYVKGFKLAKAKKSFTAKWKKQSKANQKKFTGYRIKYSTNANMSGAKTVYVGKTKASKKIKGLVSKKKYYVEISTYVKNANGTFYSKPVKKSVVVK